MKKLEKSTRQRILDALESLGGDVNWIYFTQLRKAINDLDEDILRLTLDDLSVDSFILDTIEHGVLTSNGNLVNMEKYRLSPTAISLFDKKRSDKRSKQAIKVSIGALLLSIISIVVSIIAIKYSGK